MVSHAWRASKARICGSQRRGGLPGSGAFCGDGVINQDFEECDVLNPDQGGAVHGDLTHLCLKLPL